MNLIKRITLSLIFIALGITSTGFILPYFSVNALNLLYILGPMLFAHFIPLLFIKHSKHWRSINSYLPEILDCGNTRTINGSLIIILSGIFFYFLIYFFSPYYMDDLFTNHIAMGPYMLLMSSIVIASVIGDILSHTLANKIKLKEVKVIWHFDTILAGIFVLNLFSSHQLFKTIATLYDYFIAILYYGLAHYIFDVFIYWNKTVGIKSFKA